MLRGLQQMDCFLFHMGKKGKNKNNFHMPSDCFGEIK